MITQTSGSARGSNEESKLGSVRDSSVNSVGVVGATESRLLI